MLINTKESGDEVKNKKIVLMLIIILILMILDQITKAVVVRFVDSQIALGFFAIEKVTNDGMAFGFNSGNTRNIFMTIFVIGIIINFIVKQIGQIDGKTAIALGLILGGGLSNLIDRFIRHGVLDYIRVGQFFTCNLADICIFVGWIMLILFIVFFSNSEKKESEKKE